jgi:hypothetical protein
MNNTSLAIQKAVERGYRFGDFSEMIKIEVAEQQVWWTNGEGGVRIVSFSDLYLDPLFWMALGKTEGWGSFYDDEGMPRVYSTQGWYPDTKDFSSGQDEMMWQAYQHRLIDAIQQGRSIDEFFGEILKK